jgi:hypothetical protein
MLETQLSVYEPVILCKSRQYTANMADWTSWIEVYRCWLGVPASRIRM